LRPPASCSLIPARGSTNALGEVYVLRGKYDAYAATGVEGDSKEVDFRAGVFKWKEWDAGRGELKNIPSHCSCSVCPSGSLETDPI
jgi:hypothetical protein